MQGEQADEAPSPLAFPYVPIGHELDDDDDSGQYEPCAHVSNPVPSRQTFPGKQGKHAGRPVPPGEGLYVPAGHAFWRAELDPEGQ